jgi:hypothetical protein
LHQLSQSKTIGQLKGFTEAALSDVQIPYLGLTKICHYLLQYIRDRLVRSSFEKVPKIRPGESIDKTLVWMAGHILHQNLEQIEQGRKAGRQECICN